MRHLTGSRTTSGLVCICLCLEEDSGGRAFGTMTEAERIKNDIMGHMDCRGGMESITGVVSGYADSEDLEAADG